MQLAALDEMQLFSITAWQSAEGWTVGIQRRAGDLVHYETRRTLSGALEAVLPSALPALPYQ
jgi:hypothetical protein